MISIIIATFNAEDTLQSCFDSIIPQLCGEVELIVIDGESKDSTVDIIKDYSKNINWWISEKDDGVYDAWNKGLNIAKGEWVMFLGADDQLVNGALDQYLNFVNDSNNLDIVSSLIRYVDSNGSNIKLIGEPWNWNKFKRGGLQFAHPGLLHNMRLFEENGCFDSTFKICGDAEFFYRIGESLKAGYLNAETVIMRTGGISYSVDAIIEAFQARKINKVIPLYQNIFVFLYKLLLFWRSYLLLRIFKYFNK
jgi:glycosyltransferase involved in cell wall biosynthesis